jgi:plasmid stabilization system protein ParE
MRKLIWSKRATNSFGKILDYIESDSIQNAEKVALEVLQKVKYAAKHPEFYNRDKYKTENPKGAFRAFEIYHIRVSLYFDEKVVRVVRVRHTKQKPLKY